MFKKLLKAFPIASCSIILSYFGIAQKAMLPSLILFISGYLIYRLTEFIVEDIFYEAIIDILIVYGFMLLVDVYMVVLKYNDVGCIIIPAAILCVVTGYFHGYNTDLIDYDPEFWDESKDDQDDQTK